MKTIVKFSLILLLLGASMAGQAQTDVKPINNKPDKVKLKIRPNSREFGVTMRTNNLQRRDKVRKSALLIEKPKIQKNDRLKQRANQSTRPNIDKNKNQIKRNEMMQRRKLMMQQKRALRK